MSNDEHHADANEDKLHYPRNHDAARIHRLLVSGRAAIDNHQCDYGPDAEDSAKNKR